jgi:uncharacterized damage-inducible protein DinB
MHSIRGQVTHMMDAESIWLARIGGTSPTAFADVQRYADKAEFRAAYHTHQGMVSAFFDSLTDPLLDREIAYRTVTGREYQQRMWQILVHVANHGTDHRAQTLAMLHQMGAPTVDQDIIFYLRETS